MTLHVWFELTETRSNIEARTKPIKLGHEVVPTVAYLHHRHDRSEVFSNLGIAFILGESLK